MKTPRNQADIRLVAFLGNPERRYANTRHNAGWLVADRVVPDDSRDWKEKFHGRFSRRGSLVLLKPQTYINNSGRSVQAALAFFSLTADQLLVVSDDLETAFGTVQIVWGGGHRGHNGIRSIANSLSTSDFWRLRLGIGRPPATRRVADWVLERFTREEEAALPDVLDTAESYIADLLHDKRGHRG